MADTGDSKAGVSGSPQDQEIQQSPEQQEVEDVEEEESDEEESEADLEKIDVEKGTDGVQKNIGKLLKVMIKDQRRRTEHRTDVRKPTDFKGTESARDARNWLISLDRYYRNRKVKSDDEKVNTALSYHVGKAAEFARRIDAELDAFEEWEITEEGKRAEKEPVHCKSWDEFKERFTREFIDVDPVQTAREELRKLRMDLDQKAEEFITEFKNLATETGYDDAALVDMFQVAIPPRITNKILELRKRPKGVSPDIPNYRPETLDEWYELAADYDRSYRQSRQRMNEIKGQNNNRSKGNTPNTSSSTGSQPKTGQNNGYRSNFRNNTSGGQDSGNNRRVTFHTRAAKDMSDVICYRCDKKGHISRDCPTRASGSGQTRQSQPVNIRATDLQAQIASNSLSDETLDLLTRALQSANAQRAAGSSGAGAGSGKGKEPQKGFRRGRK